MKLNVALGQFTIAKEWQTNLETCKRYIKEASEHQIQLLVFPEGILAQDITDPELVHKAAQPLDGEFMSALLAYSQAFSLTVIMTVHVPTDDDQTKVWNTQIAIRAGKVLAKYRKLHLYDAFAIKESENVVAGNEVPPLVDVDGFKIGMMTCYDVRFPELGRRLALDGADILVLPAAWIKGPLKEHHWHSLVTVRALENTCYILAVGASGPRNIGLSQVVDPLGVTIAGATEQDGLLVATVERDRIQYARDILPVLENRRFATPTLQTE